MPSCQGLSWVTRQSDDSPLTQKAWQRQIDDSALGGIDPGVAIQAAQSSQLWRAGLPAVGREQLSSCGVREVVSRLAWRHFGGHLASEVGDDLSGDGFECGDFLGGEQVD